MRVNIDPTDRDLNRLRAHPVRAEPPPYSHLTNLPKTPTNNPWAQILATSATWIFRGIQNTFNLKVEGSYKRERLQCKFISQKRYRTSIVWINRGQWTLQALDLQQTSWPGCSDGWTHCRFCSNVQLPLVQLRALQIVVWGHCGRSRGSRCVLNLQSQRPRLQPQVQVLQISCQRLLSGGMAPPLGEHRMRRSWWWWRGKLPGEERHGEAALPFISSCPPWAQTLTDLQPQTFNKFTNPLSLFWNLVQFAEFFGWPP